MRTPTFRLLIAFVTLLTFIGCDPELKVVPEVTTTALTLLTTTSAGSGGTVTGEGASKQCYSHRTVLEYIAGTDYQRLKKQ